MYLFMLFALAHSLIQFEKNTSLPTIKNSKFPPSPMLRRADKIQDKLLAVSFWPLAFVGILVLIFSIKNFNISLLAANYHLNKGQALYEKVGAKEALMEYEKGLARWTPVAQFLHYGYAANALLYLNEKEGLPKDEMETLLAKGIEHVDRVIRERPFYTRGYILGGLLANTGYEQIGLLYKEKAETYLAKAQMLSPNRTSIFKIRALGDLVEKNFKAAEEKLLQAIAINENGEELHWVLALTYLRSNQLEKFYGEFEKESKRNPRAKDEFNLVKIADICFREIKQYGCAADFFARLTKKNPENPKYWTSLALSLKLSGDINGAKQAAEHAKTIADPLLQNVIDEFLKTL
jgi:tetratricopeptide (TPR) repeat protein